MIMISSNVIFNFTNFCVIASFLTKLLTLGILFSTAVRAVVIAKLVTLGILFLASFILALKVVSVGNIRYFIFHIFYLSIICIFFLTTSFLNTSLSLLKSIGAGSKLSTSNLYILLFKILKLVGTYFNYQYLIYLH